jgi:uncharacterized protein (TIGR03067 family)
MDEKLKGHWKVVACQLNGIWLPREIFMMFRYEITEGAFKIHWADLSFPNWVGSFPKSDSGKIIGGDDGKIIDFVPDKGPNAGKNYQGLYHLDFDVLKANFAFPGHDRPSEFNAKDGHVFEVWQRVYDQDSLIPNEINY